VDERKLDPERLAALIDGRLSSRERAKALASLAADGDTAEAFADAAAVVNELEPLAVTPKVERFGSGSARRWRWPLLGAVAASIVLAAMLLRPSSKSARLDSIPPLEAYAEAVTSGGVTAPASTLWANRGSEGGATVGSHMRAARIGASITDLSLALRSRDTGALAATDEIIRNLSKLAGSGPAIARYQQLRAQLLNGSTPASETSRDAARSAASVAGPASTRFGAWLEAVRVAASRNDSAFFVHNKSVMPDTRELDAVPMSPTERATFERLRALLVSATMNSAEVFQRATILLAALAT